MGDIWANYLDINLSTREIKTYAIDSSIGRSYLGGVGLNSYLLYQNLPAGIDALGEENVIIFSAGTLAGLPFPTAARTEASAKSPLTGRFGTSNSGMFFGGHLKKAGFDGVIIRGRADMPVHLVVAKGEAQLVDAGELWGKDSWDALEMIESKHPRSESAVIGPAGENLVRFASIQNGRYDAWGRTGLGAVMGSKNLKALTVVDNKEKPAMANRESFMKTAREASKALQSSPFYEPFKKMGTMNASPVYSRYNAFGAHNFTKGTLPDWNENFGKKMVEHLVKKSIACQSCAIACGHWVEIEEGPYKGLKIKDMEITPVATFGAQCGLNTGAAVKAAELCQRLGMDMVSAGSSVAMAIDMYQGGLLSEEDIGYSLDWGHDEAVFRLFHDIAYQRGFGKTMGQGTARAAASITGGNDFAIQVKGMEIPMIDPRGRWSTWTMGMLTNPRGGDHLRCRNPVENLRFNETDAEMMTERFGMGEKEYKLLDMPQELKARIIDLEKDTVNIPWMSKWAEDLIHLFNSLGICIRPPVLNRIGPSILAEAVSAYTGQEISGQELMQAAERSWNLIKLFNLREGERIEEFKFPARFYREKVNDKSLNDDTVDMVLKEYFKARAWDQETGVPTTGKLHELGLDCL